MFFANYQTTKELKRCNFKFLLEAKILKELFTCLNNKCFHGNTEQKLCSKKLSDDYYKQIQHYLYYV